MDELKDGEFVEVIKSVDGHEIRKYVRFSNSNSSEKRAISNILDEMVVGYIHKVSKEDVINYHLNKIYESMEAIRELRYNQTDISK